jgi:hypothetical protein
MNGPTVAQGTRNGAGVLCSPRVDFPRFSRQPLATAYPPERASRASHLTLLLRTNPRRLVGRRPRACFRAAARKSRTAVNRLPRLRSLSRALQRWAAPGLRKVSRHQTASVPPRSRPTPSAPASANADPPNGRGLEAPSVGGSREPSRLAVPNPEADESPRSAGALCRSARCRLPP